MEPTKAYLHFKQMKKIRSFSVNKTELKKFLQILQERSSAAAEIEVYHYKRQSQTKEEYDNAIADLRKGFELFITITGADGRKLTGNISDIFDSPNYPDDVTYVFFDTSTKLKSGFNYYPRNELVLFLDFRKHPIFNLSILLSQETINESHITVSGSDTTWVNGVFHEAVDYVGQKPSALTWIHKHSIYDIILFLIGFPFSFWLCTKASTFISASFNNTSEFVRAAAYFYVFIIGLNILRILFQYARWIWPLTEYKCDNNRALKHRIAWFTLFSSLGITIVYDLIKLLALE